MLNSKWIIWAFTIEEIEWDSSKSKSHVLSKWAMRSNHRKTHFECVGILGVLEMQNESVSGLRTRTSWQCDINSAGSAEADTLRSTLLVGMYLVVQDWCSEILSVFHQVIYFSCNVSGSPVLWYLSLRLHWCCTSWFCSLSLPFCSSFHGYRVFQFWIYEHMESCLQLLKEYWHSEMSEGSSMKLIHLDSGSINQTICTLKINDRSARHAISSL